MHYFLTGHTGFKGSWLTLMLTELGHTVSGFSLDVPAGGLYERGNLSDFLQEDHRGDVRDEKSLLKAVDESRADVCIHLAAQSLVLRSYENPDETFTTNVNGTLNFLKAVTKVGSRVSLIVTSDKVYRDQGKRAYVESDPLGGSDPYSASKSMADILTTSWSAMPGSPQILAARAGNVIGGFDSSKHRLLPDINRTIATSSTLRIRNGSMVRPWQHVLDCLNGYLMFIQAGLSGNPDLPIALNFGPDSESARSVQDLVEKASEFVHFHSDFEPAREDTRKETVTLLLNSSLARKTLGWEDRIDFAEAVRTSLETTENEDPRTVAIGQVAEFLSR